MADPRASEARRLHASVAETAALAVRQRERRDDLVRALRAEDPARWTHAALARAVGCSPELVAVICRRPVV